MRVLIIALCLVSLSQGTIIRLLNRNRHRGGYSASGRPYYGQSGAQPTGVQPRVEEAQLEGVAEIEPGTRYTKTTQKSEKSESYSSQKSESHNSESTSYTGSTTGQRGFPPIPTYTQTGFVPAHTGQGGSGAVTADATHPVGGDQPVGSGVAPRHHGGTHQTAQIRQNAASQGGGAIRQNANINQGASSGGHGGADQSANVEQQAQARSVSSGATSIRQTANVQQLGGQNQRVNVKQNASIRQGARLGSASIVQSANVQQTAGSSGVGGGEGSGGAGQGAGQGAGEGAAGDGVPPAIGGDCGANSAYCVNVNDEGFYPSSDARGHFYRCSHCSPHFFRCGPGTAYHVASRACL